MAKSFALVLLALVLFAGCARADPMGQPTYSCTPENGSTPYACYQVQHDEVLKREALYAEAEAVYRKYLAEEERILRAGGVDEPTSVMRETMSTDAVVQALETYRAFKRDGMRVEGGAMQVVWVKRQPDKLGEGMSVAVQTCVDGGSAHLVQKGSSDLPVGFVSGTVQFARDGGALKIAVMNGDQVASC